MRKISPEQFEELAGKSSTKRLPLLENSAPPKVAERLTPALLHILRHVQRDLSRLKLGEDGAERLLDKSVREKVVLQVAEKLGFELSAYERDEILAHIEKEDKPFGVLQELVDNEEISDIIVTDYATVSVQKGRKTYRTDVRFPDADAYEAFIEKLLQTAGSNYSTKKPIADGMIGSYARIHVVHSALCDTGPYLTIRLNRFDKVSVLDLIQSGLAPKEILHYLESAIRAGLTLMVVGEVGTGKTTLARAVAATMPPEESILVIEDTPEIRINHPQVRYMTTREDNTDGAGKVAPSECIRAGLRMAMNRIIFGEIRDAEAAEAFIDVCSSGHPGLSTIHARCASEAVSRLELFLGRAQKGVSRNILTQQVSQAVQVIVFLNVCRLTGRRRIMEVNEILPAADGACRQREIFRYDVAHHEPRWKVISKASCYREEIELHEGSIYLSELGDYLELAPDIRYFEASKNGSIN